MPEILASDLKDQQVFESCPVSFEVIAQGIPKPEAQWTLNGKPLTPNDHHKITEDGLKYKLSIAETKLSDAGNIQVVIKNQLGELSKQCELKVRRKYYLKKKNRKINLYFESEQNNNKSKCFCPTAVAEYRKPILLTPLKDTQSPKNSPLEFGAVLTADPLPEITWLKDGKVLEEDLDVQFKHTVKDLEHGLKEIRYFLYFPAGRHCDTGSYTLKAKNKYDAIETSAHLDILLKPEIEGFKDQLTVPFKSVTFEVQIHANPKPKVTWTKGNVNCCNIENCNVIADIEKENYT